MQFHWSLCNSIGPYAIPSYGIELQRYLWNWHDVWGNNMNKQLELALNLRTRIGIGKGGGRGWASPSIRTKGGQTLLFYTDPIKTCIRGSVPGRDNNYFGRISKNIRKE